VEVAPLLKAIVGLADKLAEQPNVLLNVLLLVFGTALFVLGAAGGVRYSGYLPIPDDVGRYLAAAGGAALLIVGIFLAVGPKQSPQPRAKSFEAKITKLVSVGPGKMEVKGNIKRHPPDGYKLMLVRFFPDNRFAPVNAEVIIEREKKGSSYEWAAYGCPINLKAGERRTVAAYLVGKSGQALFWYAEEAGRFYSSQQTEPKKYLPALKFPTEDMIKLDETELPRL
jgi:hypothetical protein